MTDLQQFLESKIVSLDIETTSESGKKKDNTNPWVNQIICIGLYDGEHKLALTADEMEEQKEILSEIITSEEIKKVAHNGKFDFLTLAVNGYGLVKNFYFDPMIAGLTLDSTGAKDLKNFKLVALWDKYFDEQPDWKIDYDAEHTVEEWCELALDDAIREYELAAKMHRLLQFEGLLDVFKLEMSVTEKMIDVERRGIPINRTEAEKLVKKYEKNLAHVEYRARKFLERAGVREIRITKYNKDNEPKVRVIKAEEIKLTSPEQISHILYKTLDYPDKTKYDKKTRSKKLTTDKDAMAELACDGHEFARWLLFFRYWTKLVEYAKKMVDNIQEDGRIHGEFNSYGTETARFSSKNPNLQQIPALTAESRAIRKAVEGDLVVIDYSNMELRILAALSQDEGLLRVYSQEDGDVHQDLVDNLKENLGFDITRSQAKNINFGVSYGAQGKGLAKQLNLRKDKPWLMIKERVDEDYAQKLIDAWYEVRPRVKAWQDRVIKTAEACGYSSAQYGHRRYLPYKGLSRHNKGHEFKLASLDRQAVNHVIQSTSAEIVKMAIHALKDENIIMQVHDELVIENPKRSLEEIEQIMENVVELGVKLTVDGHRVKCWADAK